MLSSDQIVDLSKFIFAYGSTIFGLVVIWQNYNKRKIEETRENSAGKSRLDEHEKRMDEQDKNQQEFRKDVFEILFHKPIKP